jgi:hypothetical protein
MTLMSLIYTGFPITAITRDHGDHGDLSKDCTDLRKFLPAWRLG